MTSAQVSFVSRCMHYDSDFLSATDSRNGIPPDNKTTPLKVLPPIFFGAHFSKSLSTASEEYVATLSPSTPTRNEIEISRAYRSARHGTRRLFRVPAYPARTRKSPRNFYAQPYPIQILTSRCCRSSNARPLARLERRL